MSDPSGQGNPQTCLSFPTPITAVALVYALAPPPGRVDDELGADPKLWSSPKDLEHGRHLRKPACPQWRSQRQLGIAPSTLLLLLSAELFPR